MTSINIHHHTYPSNTTNNNIATGTVHQNAKKQRSSSPFFEKITLYFHTLSMNYSNFFAGKAIVWMNGKLAKSQLERPTDLSSKSIATKTLYHLLQHTYDISTPLDPSILYVRNDANTGAPLWYRDCLTFTEAVKRYGTLEGLQKAVRENRLSFFDLSLLHHIAVELDISDDEETDCPKVELLRQILKEAKDKSPESTPLGKKIEAIDNAYMTETWEELPASSKLTYSEFEELRKANKHNFADNKVLDAFNKLIASQEEGDYAMIHFETPDLRTQSKIAKIWNRIIHYFIPLGSVKMTVVHDNSENDSPYSEYYFCKIRNHNSDVQYRSPTTKSFVINPLKIVPGLPQNHHLEFSSLFLKKLEESFNHDTTKIFWDQKYQKISKTKSHDGQNLYLAASVCNILYRWISAMIFRCKPVKFEEMDKSMTSCAEYFAYHILNSTRNALSEMQLDQLVPDTFEALGFPGDLHPHGITPYRLFKALESKEIIRKPDPYLVAPFEKFLIS